MAGTTFLHGLELIEVTSGPRPIRTVRSSVIGLVGTAPDAAPAIAAVLTIGTANANTGIKFTAANTGAGGNAVTVEFVDPAANTAALGVVVNGNAITVNLATDATGVITSTASEVMAAIDGDAGAAALVSTADVAGSDGTGVVSATGVAKSLSGGADEPFPLNEPVLIAGSRSEAAKLDSVGNAKGTLPNALDLIFDQIGAVVVVVRVAEGADAAETETNIIGGVQPDDTYTGVHALLGAKSRVGQTPRLLIAPGFTGQRDATANAVVSEMLGIADRLKATIIADGPNTTDADALTHAGDYGDRRVYIVDPFVKVQRNGVNVDEPASSAVAGLIAKVDADEGFWVSPSNHTFNGIVGTARPVDFGLSDPNCRANLLNAGNVATIVRESGFRLWGDRTCSDDARFQFLSVARTYDMVNQSILEAHLWAVDRNITKTYFDDVSESVNAYIRTLTARGALNGGKCYADPDLNTPDSIANGEAWFNVELSPPYPAEHVIFRSKIVNDYLEDLVK